MKSKILVFLDAPYIKSDYSWFYDYISEYGNVHLMTSNHIEYRLGRWRPMTFLGKIIHIIMYLKQSICILFQTTSNYIIITRSHGQGLIMNYLCRILHIKRMIVGFNWIDVPKKTYKKIAYYALINEHFIPVINDKRLEYKIKKLYSLKKWNGIFIPDTYDLKDLIIPPKPKNEKYVFSGGINNRDWLVLVEAARKTPEINYIIVVNKFVWDKLNINVPHNVKLYYDLNEDMYYKLMEGAYLTICPLKEDRVSGLINIIKSHQYGIPAISTDYHPVRQYYPECIKSAFLFKCGDSQQLADLIKMNINLNDETYVKLSCVLQKHLLHNFNPRKQIAYLMGCLRKIVSSETRMFS